MKKLIVAAIFFGIISGCASTNNDHASSNKSHASITDDAKKHVHDGDALLAAGSLKKAVSEFDQAIEICDKKYSDKKTKVFASRDQVETIYYMALAATLKIDAIAVDSTCSDALYFRGYAALDLGDIVLAQSYIERAIAMSPSNSKYLSELGHIHQTNKKWNEALETFTQSEDSAEVYSPEQVKVEELTRAKRGVGFALTELGRFDESELKYKECLKLNPNDKGAAGELEYIKSLRTKKPN